MYSKFGQFIDGQWQQAEKQETYDVINPATEEVIGKASKASLSDVDIVKIDIECYEYNFFSGAKNLLKLKPIIIFEHFR